MRPKVIFKDDPVKWTINVVDPSGQNVDPNAYPSITVKKLVGQNWVELSDPVVVTRRSIGEYDCYYQPADLNSEGDQFGIHESVQLDVGEGLQWYYNDWEYTIVSDETGSGIRNVEVTVQDTDTNIIAGAVVNVLNAAGNPLNFAAVTNTNGIAKFNLDDGDYQFQVSAISGYETHAPEPFTVTASNTTLTLTLVPITEETPETPTDDSAIDLTGIKKVRTKHMEVEAFSPEEMQRARDKEQVGPVSFCELVFCKGVYVGCRCRT